MTKSLALLVLLFITSCSNSNNKNKEITGVYRNDNYDALIIKPFGNGLQILTYPGIVPEEKPLHKIYHTATSENGFIKIQDADNTLIPIQDDAIIFGNQKYKKRANFDFDSNPSNDKEFCERIVQAIKTASPELLENFVLDQASTDIPENCVQNYFREWQIMYEFKKINDQYNDIVYSDHIFKSSELRKPFDECEKEYYSKYGRLGILCSRPQGPVYFIISPIVKSKNGKYYILDSEYSWDEASLAEYQELNK